MEFWLSFNNLQEKHQLAVPPREFTLNTGTDIKVVNINNIGEISLIGKTRLKTLTLQSFFPAMEYSFCKYRGFPKPYDCVALIEKWQLSQRPIRLVITDTPVNIAVAIEEFEYGERPGSRDVYFTLELKEYRFLYLNETPVDSELTALNARVSDKAIEETYTVKKGDNLSSVAKKVYGDAGKYADIVNKNNIANPKIYQGQVLRL